MENNPLRHHLNPAFQPIQKVYVDLPIVPTIYANTSNNSLRLYDVVYPKMINGKMQNITFLHPEGNVDNFYNQLKNYTTINTEASVDILQFGWRRDKGYYTFGLSERVEVYGNIPKDLAKLALYGTKDSVGINNHDLKRFGVKSQAFTEFALGYSRQIDEKLTVGAKAKFLIGQANATLKFKELRLNAGRDYWEIEADGQANASIPGATYSIDNDNNIDDVDINIKKWQDFLNGYGASFDLGATYSPIEHLTLSASVLDLGFIRWRKSMANIPVDGEYRFAGIDYDVKDRYTKWWEKYWKEFRDTMHYTTTKEKYNSMLSAKVLVGGEYGIVNDKIKFGVLSKTTIYNYHLLEDFTVSANFLPKNWFNANVSYSLVCNQYSTFGLGLGARLGIFYLYFAGDYMPTQFTPQYIPYKSKKVNAEFGVLLTFCNREKKAKNEQSKDAQNELEPLTIAASTMNDSYNPNEEKTDDEELIIQDEESSQE